MKPGLETTIAWGDCDETGIVFFPNYFYWMDSAYHALLNRCGFNQRSLRKQFGAATPVVEINGRFLKSATYDEPLRIDIEIESWQNKTFRLRYRGYRDADLLFEGYDVRIWATVDPQTGRLKSAPIPEAFRAALSAHA